MMNSWTDEQHAVFDAVYRATAEAQQHIKHPKQRTMKAEHWQTIAHNMAFLAAEATKPSPLYLLENGQEIASFFAH